MLRLAWRCVYNFLDVVVFVVPENLDLLCEKLCAAFFMPAKTSLALCAISIVPHCAVINLFGWVGGGTRWVGCWLLFLINFLLLTLLTSVARSCVIAKVISRS